MGLKRAASFVGFVLLELLDDFGKATDVMAFRARNYEHVLNIRRGRERRRRYQAIDYLKRKKLIEIRHTANGLSIALTAAGRMKALREQLLRQTNRLPTGQSCIVIFDIPERASLSRQTFRKFLKDSGFKMVQLSVWETRRDVFDLVMQFIRRAKIGSWVSVIHAVRKA